MLPVERESTDSVGASLHPELIRTREGLRVRIASSGANRVGKASD